MSFLDLYQNDAEASLAIRPNEAHDLPATMAQITDNAPVILMAHEPDIFPDVPARVSLTLSGHTHGGQVSMFNYSPLVPSKFGARYIYGHIIEEQRHLIVSAGLGCSTLPGPVPSKPCMLAASPS